MKNNYIFLITFLLSCPLLLTNLYAQQAGTLDTSFGTDGKVTTDIDDGSDGRNSWDIISAIDLQSDGKIIVAGTVGFASRNQQRVVARYYSNGTLDTNFGSGGSVLQSGNLFLGVVVQPDDKIVAVGEYKNDFTINRYNSDGSLDINFGSEGIVNTEYDEHSDDGARAVALQSDGKIVVGGITYYNNQSPYSLNFFMVRYNSNGSLDGSFGTNGKVVTDFFGRADGINDLAIQPDGKIVAAGFAKPLQGNEDRNFGIVRYNTDGSLDASFGEEGKVNTDFNGITEQINSLILLDDGKILVGGSTTASGYRLGLARYNSDGSLDSSFGVDGKILTENSPATKIALQDDGKIVAAGYKNDFGVARFNSDGSVDVGFGNQGETITDFADDYDHIRTLILQPDGQIIVAGSSQYENELGGSRDIEAFAMARYHGGASLGVEETNKLESLFKIYPNPVQEVLHLETQTSKIKTINLFSITGQALKSWDAQSNINMAPFAPGIYFVKITTDDNRTLVKQVIKN